MRNASLRVTELCENWWGQLADASKVEQYRYGEELLGLLGWTQALPITPKESAEKMAAAPYVLRAAGQTAVLVYFVPPGVLEAPAAMVERRLDFSPATRALISESQSLNVHYVLISDLYRTYLYDARTDDLLLYADSPKDFEREFVEVLARTEVERGALEEVRRQPRSVAARHLREWSSRWMDVYTRQEGLSEELASLLIDRLIVIRYLFDHDIMRRTRWRLQQRFLGLVERASSNEIEGCGRDLVRLFHDMWLDWRIDLFAILPALEAGLENDATTAALLREFALLSRSKFSIATVLESFNSGDPTEKMRVRMVPDSNEEREQYLNRQTVESIDAARIEIDLMEEGYRAIFHWLDRVVSLYDRLETDFESRAFKDIPQAQELDLFSWSELDSNRPSACGDKFAHACMCGFGIYYSTPRQYRIARLMLTLHLISRYDQRGQAVSVFPSFEHVMIKRPLILTSDRVMNVRSPHAPRAGRRFPATEG